MKSLEIWIITIFAAIVFIFGITYYDMFQAVENVAAFVVSLTIIFLILILVIIFSQQSPRKKIPRFEPRVKIMEKDAPEKKLKETEKKIVKKVSNKK